MLDSSNQLVQAVRARGEIFPFERRGLLRQEKIAGPSEIVAPSGAEFRPAKLRRRLALLLSLPFIFIILSFRGFRFPPEHRSRPALFRVPINLSTAQPTAPPAINWGAAKPHSSV